MVISCWLLVVGYWLFVICYWLFVIGYLLFVICYWLFVIDSFADQTLCCKRASISIALFLGSAL
ncbi:hypothetical protein QT995_12060 [Microcoleus sp. S36b_A3]